jgi:hypothetical protein
MSVKMDTYKNDSCLLLMLALRELLMFYADVVWVAQYCRFECKIVGLAYDGASVMSANVGGLQARELGSFFTQ